MMDFSALGTLGFGAAAIGNLYRAMTDENAAETVRTAWTAGMRYFDTAPHYGSRVMAPSQNWALIRTQSCIIKLLI